MINKENIHQEVERTLQSLDNAGRAVANPFLFTRIKAKMQGAQNGWETLTSFISRPAIAIAVLTVVMAVNTLALFNSDTTPASEADNTSIPGIVEEYSMTFATISDYENTEQNELYQK